MNNRLWKVWKDLLLLHKIWDWLSVQLSRIFKEGLRTKVKNSWIFLYPRPSYVSRKNDAFKINDGRAVFHAEDVFPSTSLQHAIHVHGEDVCHWAQCTLSLHRHRLLPRFIGKPEVFWKLEVEISARLWNRRRSKVSWSATAGFLLALYRLSSNPVSLDFFESPIENSLPACLNLAREILPFTLVFRLESSRIRSSFWLPGDTREDVVRESISFKFFN